MKQQNQICVRAGSEAGNWCLFYVNDLCYAHSWPKASASNVHGLVKTYAKSQKKQMMGKKLTSKTSTQIIPNLSK